MSPGLLRRARYWYGPVGISVGIAKVPMYNEFGYFQGWAIIGRTTIQGMSALIQGPGTPMEGVY